MTQFYCLWPVSVCFVSIIIIIIKMRICTLRQHLPAENVRNFIIAVIKDSEMGV